MAKIDDYFFFPGSAHSTLYLSESYPVRVTAFPGEYQLDFSTSYDSSNRVLLSSSGG